MKPVIKKGNERRDDSLYGLLSLYKLNTTYFKVTVSEEDEMIALWVTDNPGRWSLVNDTRYENHRELRRLEIGVSRLSLKYLHPEQIIRVRGPLLGIRLPSERTAVVDTYRKAGILIIETSLKHRKKLLQGLVSLVNLSPAKKFEIIEKSVIEKKNQG